MIEEVRDGQQLHRNLCLRVPVYKVNVTICDTLLECLISGILPPDWSIESWAINQDLK